MIRRKWRIFPSLLCFFFSSFQLIKPSFFSGTQLVVTNNPKLKSLKMTKLPRFEPAGSTGQQQVYIEKNPLLTKLGDFLSATMAAGCIRKAKSVCYYDPGIYTAQTGTGMGWRKILLIAGSSLLALGVIVGVAACFLIWRHNRRHYWEHRLIYKFYTDYAFGTIGMLIFFIGIL